MRNRLWLFLLVMILMISAGCGKKASTVNDPTPYTVSGKVATSDGQGIKDVVISYSGVDSGSVKTDLEGKWSASVKGSTVTISPAKENWSFEPNSKQVNAAATNVNFVGTDNTYTVSGIVHDDNDVPISGVTLSFKGIPPDNRDFGTVITSSDGRWFKSGLTGSIQVKATKNGWAFNPSTANFSKATSDYEIWGSLSNATVSVTPSSADLGLYTNNTVTFTVAFKDASGNEIESVHPVWSVKSDCLSGGSSSIGTLSSTQGKIVTFTAAAPGSAKVCIAADPYIKEIPVTVTVAKPQPPKWASPSHRTGGTETGVWVEFLPLRSTEPDIARYLIYSRLGAVEPFTYVYAGEGSQPVMGNPSVHINMDKSARGDVETFLVKAEDKWGNRSEYSLPIVVTIGGAKPKAPSISLQNSGNYITVLWDRVSQDVNNGSTNAIKYHIYRGINPITLAHVQTVNQDASNQLEWIDKSVERGTTYYYAVVAVDDDYNESIKSNVASLKAGDYTPPPAPTVLWNR